jgi:hypothetical protein
MTTLGELLTRLQDRGEVHQLLAEAGNIALTAKLDAVADAQACDPCDMALRAVDEFASRADDEAWVKLMGRIQDADSPAAACLNEMLAWSLNNHQCSLGP